MAPFAYEAGLRLGMTKSAGGNMKRTSLLQRRNYQLSKGLNTPGLNMHNYEWIDPEIWQDRINLHYGKRVPGLSAAEMDYVRRLESILHD